MPSLDASAVAKLPVEFGHGSALRGGRAHASSRSSRQSSAASQKAARPAVGRGLNMLKMQPS